MQSFASAREYFLLAALLPALPACGPGPGGELDRPTSEAAGAGAARVDTLWIEAMPEEVVLRPYRTEEGFPLPFSTRVPAGLEPRTVASGEGDAVLFLAAFGAVRADAALRIFVPREDVSTADAVSLAREMLGLQGRVEPHPGGPGWARASFQLDARERVAVTHVGERSGRPFLLTYEYPPEFGDGLAPRFARLVEEWRWEPDGPPRLTLSPDP
jgi:hypothetical protein